MAKPASAWVDRYKAGAGAGQSNYVSGVQGTTVDVVGRAIAAKSALVAGFNEAVSSGKWERKLQAVGTSGWKSAAVAKAGNYATGIAAGADRYAAAAQKLQPYVQAGQDMIKSMPAGGGGNARARLNAWFDYMSQYSG